MHTQQPTANSTHAPPVPIAQNIREKWMLDPKITYLNHGCFGARSKKVFTAQLQRLQQFEADPIGMLDRRGKELINHAKSILGPFIGAKPENFGFVTNATGGVNAVLRSLKLNPGDEILTTNHVYNAVRKTMNHLAERAGGKAIELRLPFPIHSEKEIITAFTEAINDRTRLVILDHISSPTALLFPVERIVDLCNSRGVDVLIDGAHAPGMVDLDIESLNPSYYTGNLHKWVCAPRGAAFLWVRPDRQKEIHPTTISHFLDEGFANEFAWQGTRDITPWLCVEDALTDMSQIGWERIRSHNHHLAVWTQQFLTHKWQVESTTPLDGSMLGSMTTIPLPEKLHKYHTAEQLQSILLSEYKIEIPIIDWDSRWWIRVSCQIYNTSDEIHHLASAINELLANEL